MGEISYNLEKDRTVGTKLSVDFAAKIEKLKWWLHTPRWSKINRPDFGHRLVKYQNEAMTIGILQDMEADVVVDVKGDLGLSVWAIYVYPSQDDAICGIAIVVSDGNEAGLLVDRVTE